MKKQLFSTLIVILIICCVLGVTFKYLKDKKEEPTKPTNPVVEASPSFDYKLINKLNTYNENTLISPLSIGYALSMVNAGADNNTKAELDKLLDNYSLPETIKLKDRLAIANTIFIKEDYKDKMSPNYTKSLSDNYKAELNYDKFENVTNVNKWIEDNTFGMIKDAIGEINKDTISILINTVAMDMKWTSTFECNSTQSKPFTKYNGDKIDVEMMYSKKGNNYIESYDAKGIVRYYMYYNKTTGEEQYDNKNATQFEFIAILPNGDINEYLNNFSKDELDRLLRSIVTPSSSLDITVSLPRYTYDYELKDLNGFLNNLGVNDAFDREKADFSKMVNDPELKLFIGDSLHKTHIELNEAGTKAAAVTAFMMENFAVDEKKVKSVEFNKPFIYLIKEVNSDNIYFIGTVFEPNHWSENSDTCEYEELNIE